LGHLRHMVSISETVGKVLDQFDIEHDLFRRWER
jgi:3-polyprenyl-4-hydroxybenzoate decarboxylase